LEALMRIAMTLALALFLITPTACGGDDDDDQTVVDSGTGTDPDAGDEDDAGDDTGDDGDAPDAGSESDAGPVRICGGIAGLQCEDDEYCDYEDDGCGNNDNAGTCTPRPEECEPDDTRVCGCDGEPYDNKCEAAQAGSDIAEVGFCK
jgi:hypothetical protein